MSKHTPGPWRYEQGGGHMHNSIRGSRDVQTNGWIGERGGVTNASYSDRVCENLGNIDLPGPAANARLIAAAPEMYAIIKELAHDFPHDWPEACDILARIDVETEVSG